MHVGNPMRWSGTGGNGMRSSNRKVVIEQYTNVTALTRPMVDVLIDHIRVGRRDPTTKIVPVEIHWKF